MIRRGAVAVGVVGAAAVAAAASIAATDLNFAGTDPEHGLLGVLYLLHGLLLHISGILDLLLDLRDDALDFFNFLLKGIKGVLLVLLGVGIFSLLQQGDPVVHDVDGLLQTLNRLIEFHVETQGHAQLVMGLCDASGVLRQQLLPPPQTRGQILDGLSVVFVLDGEFAQHLERLAQPRLQFQPLRVQGLQRIRVALEAVLGQL